MNKLCSDFFQQRLSLLQVSGVKALGEPVIEGSEQVVGSGMLALALPQPTQRVFKITSDEPGDVP